MPILKLHVERSFFVGLSVIIFGYVVQGRGFAYIGIPPLYIAEAVLGVGLVALALSLKKISLTWTNVLIVLFALLGLIRTVPYLGTYGLDAIRDAAIWYYAAFTFLVSTLITKERTQMFLRGISNALPLIAVWYLFMSTVLGAFADKLPHYPGSPVPILNVVGPGHRAVVLAALAAYVASGLYTRFAGDKILLLPVFWALWAISAVIIAAETRGGMLALVASAGVLMLVRPSILWLKAAVIGIAVFVLLLLFDPTFNFGHYRSFSVGQITSNVISIFSDNAANQGSVDDTKDWRLGWWTDIYNDVVHGQYFWQGWGFGPNLAIEYDISQGRDLGLRSPHNGHLTVLGRMGVPGFFLWVLVNLSFIVPVVKKCFIRPNRTVGYSDVYVWIFAVWVAMMVESTFDVYLEGPHGGILFWCLLGFGVGVQRVEAVGYVEADANTAEPSSITARESADSLDVEIENTPVQT